MPRTENRLAPTKVAILLKNREPGVHRDGGGLRLIITKHGSCSWTYRYSAGGKEREAGLGSAVGKGAVTLANARKKRDALRVQVRDGTDPIGVKKQEKAKAAADAQAAKIAGKTFRVVAGDYIRANEASWRNAKHRQQWTNTLEDYVYPVIGDLPVAEVGTPHVLEILEPIWTEKPETASRVRGRIETVLDAAKVRGYREGENPARWRGHLAHILPARSKLTRGHHTALPHDLVPAFVEKLRGREAVASLAMQFAILTAARTGEVIGAKWDEVDLDKAIWTIPADRMKAGREHRVPLSPRAVEILEETQKLGSAYLFRGGRGGKLSSMGMAMLLRRMGVDMTVHGFRSAFRDWAAECTGYAHEVCEMALAHTIANKAEAAYRRGDCSRSVGA